MGGRAAAASIRRRLASLIYECMLVTALLALAWLFPHVLIGVLWRWTAPAWLLWLHFFLLPGIYFSWLWHRGGRTLAMQTWKLQLVDAASGAPPSPTQAVLRYCLAWPSMLCLGIGMSWAVFDKDRQFLHDRLAGTRIIFVQPTTASPPP